MVNLKELSVHATSGIWGQYSPITGPFQDEAQEQRRKGKAQYDSSHDMSTLREDGSRYRLATFTHANDAAFAEALVNAFRAGELVFKSDARKEAFTEAAAVCSDHRPDRPLQSRTTADAIMTGILAKIEEEDDASDAA